MDTVISFVRRFVSLGLVQWRRGDPLLMGAAIAYNTLFALVPLAVAFVAIVSLFEFTQAAIEEFVRVIESAFPADVAAFLVQILDQSIVMVRDDQGVVLGVSIAIALWSGSRAVYAVQKSLRLIQGGEDDRGYVRARVVGILVTVGALAGVLVGYAFLVFGEVFFDVAARRIGIVRGGQVQFLLSLLSLLLVYVFLWAIYRYGPPRPVAFPEVTAGIVEAIVVPGSVLIFRLMSLQTADALAVFGALGVILAWAYFIGIVLVVVPIGVGAAVVAWSEQSDRYAQGDEQETHEDEDRGSQDGDLVPPQTAR